MTEPLYKDDPCTRCGGKRDVIKYPIGRSPRYAAWCKTCNNEYHSRRNARVAVERLKVCVVCGGPRDVPTIRRGKPVLASKCKECQAAIRDESQTRNLQKDNHIYASDWDAETAYIYNAVHWRRVPRPKVQTVYKRAEILVLPAEKLVRILDLARKGEVVII